MTSEIRTQLHWTSIEDPAHGGIYTDIWYVTSSPNSTEWFIERQAHHCPEGALDPIPLETERWCFDEAQPYIPAEAWEKALLERNRIRLVEKPA
jgi:hypothetical protein